VRRLALINGNADFIAPWGAVIGVDVIEYPVEHCEGQLAAFFGPLSTPTRRARWMTWLRTTDADTGFAILRAALHWGKVHVVRAAGGAVIILELHLAAAARQ